MIPSSLGTIAAHIAIDDSGIDRGVNTAMNKLEGMQKKIRQSGFGMIKIGLVIAAPLALATKTFAAFDDAMRATQAVTQASAEEFKELTAQAKFLGRTTSYTARQVAEADLVLGRAGQNVGKTIGPILNLARATGTDLAQAADYASNILNAFGLKAGQMERVADVLVTGSNNAAQTLGDLGQSMVYASKVAEQFGLSLEQTTKYISAMADVGIKGSMAGTSLRMAMLQLTKGDVQEKLRKGLGVEVVDQATGEMKDLLVILNEMTVSIKKMGMGPAKKLEIFTDTFGARAMAGMLALSSKNFDKLNKAMANAGNTAAKVAKDMDAGIGGSLRMLWSAVEGTTIAIGEALAPTLSKLSSAFIAVLSIITPLIENHKWLIQILGYLAAGLLIYGTGLVAISFKTVVLAFATKGLVASLGLLRFALALAISPLGILIGILAAIAYATGAFSREVVELTKVDMKRAEKVKQQNAESKMQIERLEQLRNKEKLNNEEMEEAIDLVNTLNDKYGGLGINIDEATGKITGLTEAYKKMSEESRERELFAINDNIAKLTSNADKLIKSLDNVNLFQSLFTGVESDTLKQIDEIYKQRDVLLDQKVAFLKPKEDKTLEEKIAAESRALIVAAEQSQAWIEKVQDLKLGNIEDETKKTLAEIDLRYKREIAKAEENKVLIDLINKARAIEVAQATTEANKAKAKQAEEELSKVQSLEQRIDMIKARGLKDEHARKIAEINTRYKYELEQAKGNAELIKKLGEAKQLELSQVAQEAEVTAENKPLLPAAVEKGTAEAFSAVIRQESDPAKNTAKNTGEMVKEQKKTNEFLKYNLQQSAPTILSLGL